MCVFAYDTNSTWGVSQFYYLSCQLFQLTSFSLKPGFPFSTLIPMETEKNTSIFWVAQVNKRRKNEGWEGGPKNLKNSAQAGWPRRLELVCSTVRAEVDVIGVQRCQIAWATFPSEALSSSARSLPLIIVNNSPNMRNAGYFPDCCLFSVTNGSIQILYLARDSKI